MSEYDNLDRHVEDFLTFYDGVVLEAAVKASEFRSGKPLTIGDIFHEVPKHYRCGIDMVGIFPQLLRSCVRRLERRKLLRSIIDPWDKDSRCYTVECNTLDRIAMLSEGAEDGNLW